MVRMLRPRLSVLDTRVAKPAPKIGDPFYASQAWIELRNRTRRECRGRCQAPGCKGAGRIVDHVLERRDRPDLELDRSNTTLLCDSHHTLKTARERAARMARPSGGPR